MAPNWSECWPPAPHTSAPAAAMPKAPPACPKYELAADAPVVLNPFATGAVTGHPVKPNWLAFSDVRYCGATPAAQITSRAPAGQLAPVTLTLLISLLLWAAAFGAETPPELYQLFWMVLSLVLLRRLYALVKTNDPPWTTLFS